MQRPCDRCGRMYEAQRKTSRFCGNKCRSSQRSPRHVSVLPSAPAPVSSAPEPDYSLVAAVSAELVKHDRLDTVSGQQAVFLAGRIHREISGSAVAALSKEIRAVMDLALEGVAQAADPLDELRARRDRLRSG